jgi:hypothetical protein
MPLDDSTISLSAAGVLVVYTGTVFLWVSNTVATLRKEINQKTAEAKKDADTNTDKIHLELNTAREKAITKIDSRIDTLESLIQINHTDSIKSTIALEKLLNERLQRASESEAKRRHDASNAIQVIITKLDSDIRAFAREATPRSEVVQIETRMANNMQKLESRLEKLDEKLSVLPELKAQHAQMMAIFTEATRNNKGNYPSNTGSNF